MDSSSLRHKYPLLLALLVLAFQWSSGLGAQDQVFTVAGKITNETAGAPQPDGLRLQVTAFSGANVSGSWETRLESDGTYRLEDVPRMEGATYVAGVEYQGALYGAAFDLPPEGQPAVADLAVYEAVSSDPGLRFEQSAIIVAGVAWHERTVTLHEVHTVLNPTDRAFVPRADGPGGPSGFLVFGLPAHAFELRPERGLDPSQLVQIDRGFASLGAIPPGRRDIVFVYRFPYADETYRLERTVRYPTASVRVLSPLAGPTLESQQLGAPEPVEVGGRQYQSLAGGPFGPGETVRLTLGGLPAAGGPLNRVPVAAVAAGGVAAGIFALLLTWRWKRPAPQGGYGEEQEAIVEELVALEEARAEGRISPENYALERAELVSRIQGTDR